jgi:NAD(P)H dehydrogenase (quinone)
MYKATTPILVTGAAAGKIGSVGFKIVEILRKKGVTVRAMVRQLDERVEALKNLGAEVVKGDLTDLTDVNHALSGCKRLYFGMAVSSSYLEATVNTAAVAKHLGVELFLNISQMTVSEMSFSVSTESPQQKQHWLAEQVLNWSGLPVVHVRPTVFLENPIFDLFAIQSIRETGALELPFGKGKSSPIAADDVARVMAEILISPEGHIGKVYQLTGPKSLDPEAIAREYARGLGQNIKYQPISLQQWEERYLIGSGLPDHVKHHLATLASRHCENYFDRWTGDVEKLTGEKPQTIEAWVRAHAREFRLKAETSV